MPTPRAITLEFAARAEVHVGEIADLGDVLTGRRRIIPIVGGHFSGPLLNAAILPGGADWQIVATDGTAIIDTRYTAETSSGAAIYVTTNGFRHGPPDVVSRLARGELVPPDDYVFRLTARLECGAPELEWVNRTVFVATAERRASMVIYDLYALR